MILLVIIAICITVFGIFRVQDIALKKLFPKEYSEYVERYAREYNIDPLLIYSVIKAESNFNPEAMSNMS